MFLCKIAEKRIRRSIDIARRTRNAIYSNLKARFQRQTGSSEARCRTFFETSCTTKYVEKNPGQVVADTRCEKLPVELCGLGEVFLTINLEKYQSGYKLKPTLHETTKILIHETCQILKFSNL